MHLAEAREFAAYRVVRDDVLTAALLRITRLSCPTASESVRSSTQRSGSSPRDREPYGAPTFKLTFLPRV